MCTGLDGKRVGPGIRQHVPQPAIKIVPLMAANVGSRRNPRYPEIHTPKRMFP